MKLNLNSILLAVVLCLPATALAHPGHGGNGFLGGFAHPFLGLDHLLAMAMVGTWSVLHGRRVWQAPALFMAMLAIGAVAGQGGIALPGLEPMVAASVVLLGLMLAMPLRLDENLALGLIGGFAFCHGLAHGSALSSGTHVLAGMLLGSAVLHGIGMLLAHLALRHRQGRAHALGRAVAWVGGALVVSTLL
jgi:urease accessory protein